MKTPPSASTSTKGFVVVDCCTSTDDDYHPHDCPKNVAVVGKVDLAVRAIDSHIRLGVAGEIYPVALSYITGFDRKVGGISRGIDDASAREIGLIGEIYLDRTIRREAGISFHVDAAETIGPISNDYVLIVDHQLTIKRIIIVVP